MAYSSCILLLLLLLLIGGISTNLPQVYAMPIFWCSSEARKDMMRAETAKCNKSNVLPSPVLMPYMGVNLTEWNNKTLQQKQTEILEDLQLFDLLIHNETSLQCMRTTKIKNYVTILKNAPVEKDNITSTQHPKQTREGKTVGDVLNQYKILIEKKLNYFVQNLQLTNCKRQK